jgi:predicted membrane channel-forming protein YqfA (hemolysin III family)
MLEVIVSNLYLTTVSSVLLNSTIYHTSISHSVPVANRCLCNDWQSVALLAGSSSVFNGYFELFRHGYKWEYFTFVMLNAMTTYKVAKLCVKSVKDCSRHTSVCKDLQQDQKERELSILQRTILSVSLALSCYLTWLLHWWKRGEK